MLVFQASAFGQEKTVAKARQTHINIFGVKASLPMPNWQKGNDIAEESEIYRSENRASFLIELIPKGEDFSSWTRLYAFRADKTPKLTLSDVYDRQVGVYLRVCTNENLKRQTLAESKMHVLFVLLCEDSPMGTGNSGYGPGIGEISVFWIGRQDGITINVYQHWRGRSFDINELSTWPASKQQIQQVIEKFGKIQVR